MAIFNVVASGPSSEIIYCMVSACNYSVTECTEIIVRQKISQKMADWKKFDVFGVLPQSFARLGFNRPYLCYLKSDESSKSNIGNQRSHLKIALNINFITCRTRSAAKVHGQILMEVRPRLIHCLLLIVYSRNICRRELGQKLIRKLETGAKLSSKQFCVVTEVGTSLTYHQLLDFI